MAPGWDFARLVSDLCHFVDLPNFALAVTWLSWRGRPASPSTMMVWQLIFLKTFSSRIHKWGNDPIWRAYFPNELKPPTSCCWWWWWSCCCCCCIGKSPPTFALAGLVGELQCFSYPWSLIKIFQPFHVDPWCFVAIPGSSSIWVIKLGHL